MIYIQLRPPKYWQVFEDVCLRLYRHIWKCESAQKNGRPGQGQDGVDISGKVAGTGWIGVQCKLKSDLVGGRLSAHEIRREVEAAKGFKPPLSQLVLATTSPRDTEAQLVARLISEEHEEQGLFRVSVAAWDDLEAEIQTIPELLRWFLSDLGLAPTHSGVMAPPKRPPHYLERAEYLDEIKAALLSEDGSRVGITATGKVGVQGMGGIGKTVLAGAIAEDREVQKAFPDGIYWVTVSQGPDLLRLLQELAFVLGEVAVSLRSIHQAKLYVSRMLSKKRALLVLDDVWNAEHASALDVLDYCGRLLITTRNRQVLHGLGAHETIVGLLPEQQARIFLAEWSRQPVDKLPPEAHEVVKECGRLPLALAMIGAMVALTPRAWDVALAYLRQADLDRIERAFPEYPYPDLLKALGVSVDALPQEYRERYVELAVFPEDAAIPRSAILTLWGMAGLSFPEGEHLLIHLIALSLIQSTAEDCMIIHDLQSDYLRHQVADIPALHSRLIDAYRQVCPGGLSYGADDGYFFQRISYHLVEAGLRQELRDLLYDFSWLRSKLAATNVYSLIADFEFLVEDEEAQAISGALRLSAHILSEQPQQLASQLAGRLLSRPASAIKHLFRGMIQASANSAWLRLMHPTLTQPGGLELQIFKGHDSAVQSVAFVSEDSIVSASEDNTIRVWDVKSGEVLKVLKGHTAAVQGVSCVGEGRVVSASEDSTLRVWDVVSGKTIQVLRGHTDWIFGATSVGNGQVVSASEDGALRVWDMLSGRTVRILEGHSAGVNAVAFVGGKLVVSASSDGTLRLWDTSTGEMIRTYNLHTSEVRCVATAGGLVASASDNTIHVWDAAKGNVIAILEGHSGWVYDVAFIGRRRVISASADGTLRVWNAEGGEAIHTLKGHASKVNAVASLNEGLVVSASSDHTLRVWNVPSNGSLVQSRQPHFAPVRYVKFLGNARAISASQDGMLQLWDVINGRSVQVLHNYEHLIFEAYHRGDGHVVLYSSGGLEEWDVETGKVTPITRASDRSAARERYFKSRYDEPDWGPLPWGRRVARLHGVTVFARGKSLTVSKANETTRSVLEGHTSTIKAIERVGESQVVSASLDGTIRLWDTASLKSLAVLSLEAWVLCIAVHPVSRQIVVGDAVGRVHFVQIEGVDSKRRENSNSDSMGHG